MNKRNWFWLILGLNLFMMRSLNRKGRCFNCTVNDVVSIIVSISILCMTLRSSSLFMKHVLTRFCFV